MPDKKPTQRTTISTSTLGKIRAFTGTTQNTVAEKASITTAAVSQLETGSNPQLKTLGRWAKACGLELSVTLTSPDGHIFQVPIPEIKEER